MPEIWCERCDVWIKVPRDSTTREMRQSHAPQCSIDAIEHVHPDLIKLDAMLQAYYDELS